MGSTIRVELETQDAECPTGRTGRIQIRGFESLPAFAVRGVPWRPRENQIDALVKASLARTEDWC